MMPKPSPDSRAKGRQHTRRSIRTWVALALAAALFATACTGDREEPTPTATQAPRVATPTPTSPPSDKLPTTIALPSIADLVDQVEPAVVSIQVRVRQMTAFGPMESLGSGSGVIFRQDGYILTNNHVIQDAVNIRVALSDGRELEAKLIGADRRTDLAVIKVDEEGLPTVPLGDASKLRVGDWVIAIGNALGLQGGPSVTLGVISALGRTLPTDPDVTLYDLIQTDAAINPGNSGGPLINLQGEVVGINTAVLRGEEVQGIGFAVSAETAMPVAEQLVDMGRVTWPYLGISGGDVNLATAAQMDLSVREGVLIVRVEPGGPADRAGIKAEDVIVAMDSHPIPDFRALQRLLQRQFSAGQQVTVSVARGDDRKEFTLILGEFPQ